MSFALWIVGVLLFCVPLTIRTMLRPRFPLSSRDRRDIDGRYDKEARDFLLGDRHTLLCGNCAQLCTPREEIEYTKRHDSIHRWYCPRCADGNWLLLAHYKESSSCQSP